MQASAVNTGPCQMVSYLIVRLEMQYFHIAFHTAVTSPGASDMPEKNAHGTERKFGKSFKNTELQKLPLKEPEGVVCVHSLLDHKLHPTSFTFHRGTHKEVHSVAAEVTVSVLFQSSPCPSLCWALSFCSSKLPDDQVR